MSYEEFVLRQLRTEIRAGCPGAAFGRDEATIRKIMDYWLDHYLDNRDAPFYLAARKDPWAGVLRTWFPVKSLAA